MEQDKIIFNKELAVKWSKYPNPVIIVMPGVLNFLVASLFLRLFQNGGKRHIRIISVNSLNDLFETDFSGLEEDSEFFMVGFKPFDLLANRLQNETRQNIPEYIVSSGYRIAALINSESGVHINCNNSNKVGDFWKKEQVDVAKDLTIIAGSAKFPAETTSSSILLAILLSTFDPANPLIRDLNFIVDSNIDLFARGEWIVRLFANQPFNTADAEIRLYVEKLKKTVAIRSTQKIIRPGVVSADLKGFSKKQIEFDSLIFELSKGVSFIFLKNDQLKSGKKTLTIVSVKDFDLYNYLVDCGFPVFWGSGRTVHIDPLLEDSVLKFLVDKVEIEIIS